MQKNTGILMAVIALVVGIAAGYCVSGNNDSMRFKHHMSDGSMMNNYNRGMSGMMGDMNAMLEGKKGDDFDKAFLSEMVVHHQGAVAMAQAALKDAKHQEIKDLANAIIGTQNKEIAEMQSWQKNWYGM
jgi:uncharacterized protein (DUF305 family)